jgi:leucyl-tRNA synthetase
MFCQKSFDKTYKLVSWNYIYTIYWNSMIKSVGIKNIIDKPRLEESITPKKTPNTVSEAVHNKVYYTLAMFPYPSGAGMHVWHVMNYTANDVVARFHRMNGKTVFNPIGWDAFGLPTENYAISVNKKAHQVTQENIINFKQQAEMMNWDYNWSNEINTSSPEYYKWTQWIFLKLMENWLAYRGKGYVNWCPNDKTVLANDQVINGCCERCWTQIIQEMRPQWFIAITKYADQLLSDLEDLDWPEETKIVQREWIGKRVGCEADFIVEGEKLPVFFDSTNLAFHCNTITLAPEHPLVTKYISTNSDPELNRLMKTIVWMKMVDRKNSNNWEWEINWKAINPLSWKTLSLYVSPSVMPDYAGWAIWKSEDKNEGGSIPESNEQEAYLVDKVRIKTIYKLRDWSVSRQRYWGAPIPVWYDKDGNPRPVKEEELPVLLPLDIDDYHPTGKSPLASHPSFARYTRDWGEYLRECDTLDTFMCSSFYHIRFPDNKNSEALISEEIAKKYLPVDFYIGWREHSVWHLLYSRFIHKFLFNLGIVPTNEPFQKLVHQGMVLASDGRKMSKRWGNVVNPNDICKQYGSDSLRTYVMFMWPIEDSKNWNEKSLEAIVKFLKRCDKLKWFILKEGSETDLEMEWYINDAISWITNDINRLRLNTAVSKIMILLNHFEKKKSITSSDLQTFSKLLSPFAPILSQELWLISWGTWVVSLTNWPTIKNIENLPRKKISIGVQINGKRRSEISLFGDADKETALNEALLSPDLKKYLQFNTIANIIYIPGKILNIIITND